MTLGDSQDTGRQAELAESLAAVQADIAAACLAAGRDSSEVRLIAVTKTFPVPDIMTLARLGVTDIGENKDQEAAPKVAACAAAGLRLRWHFIGQLQVNKVASVVRYADMVHSVDRPRLVTALSSRASAVGRVIQCLIQVSLDPEAADGPDARESGRGGASPAQALDLAAQIEAAGALELAGVMGIAPLGQPARPAYARLREVADAVRSACPQATVISAGMSADLHDAIAEGATHVRIGTALLGGRRAFVR